MALIGMPDPPHREPEPEGPWSRERRLRAPVTSVPLPGLEDQGMPEGASITRQNGLANRAIRVAVQSSAAEMELRHSARRVSAEDPRPTTTNTTNYQSRCEENRAEKAPVSSLSPLSFPSPPHILPRTVDLYLSSLGLQRGLGFLPKKSRPRPFCT